MPPPPVGVVDPGDPPGGTTKLNWSALVKAVAPPPAQTRMWLVPGAPAGATRTICVFVAEMKAVVSTAGAPNSTLQAPISPSPVMVTMVPPPLEPLDGSTLVTDGKGQTYENLAG